MARAKFADVLVALGTTLRLLADIRVTSNRFSRVVVAGLASRYRVEEATAKPGALTVEMHLSKFGAIVRV